MSEIVAYVVEIFLVGLGMWGLQELLKLSLIRLQPCVWLVIGLHGVWKLLKQPPVVLRLGSLKKRTNVVMAYLIIGAIGAGVACLYWYGLTSFFGPKIRTYEKEQQDKKDKKEGDAKAVDHGDTAKAPGVVKPSGEPAAAKRLKPLTKFDNFVVTIPLNTSASTAPIPLDENEDDPHADFYRDLFRIATRSQIVGQPAPLAYDLATDDEQFKFVTRLMQVYIFNAVFSMTRESFGVAVSPKGVTPISNKAVVPPDDTKYPTDSIIAELSSNPAFNESVAMVVRSVKAHLPSHSKFVFLEEGTDAKQGKPFTCIVRIVRDGFFAIDLKAMPVGAANLGALPTGFKSSYAAPMTRAHSIAVSMQVTIERRSDDEFEPEVYATWATDLFAELRKRTTY